MIKRLNAIQRALFKHRNPIGRGLAYLRMFGGSATIRKLVHIFAAGSVEDYGSWIDRYDTLSSVEIVAIQHRIDAMSSRPLISLVMLVVQPEPALLERATNSVRRQLYPDWRLHIISGASINDACCQLLETMAAEEPRIAFRSEITANEAIERTDGAFVGLMGDADVLAASALFAVAEEIISHPDAVLIYTDEDQIDDNGYRSRPAFKSGWNPELLYGWNYLGRLAVFRTDAVRDAGGFRTGYEAAAEYDLILRVMQRIHHDQIRHVPRILYHRQSAELQIEPGPSAEARALEDHFDRTDVTATVQCMNGFLRRVVRPMPDPPPHVTLIIPTRDRVELLRSCVSGILDRTAYQNLSVMIVDNDSRQPQTLAYLSAIENNPRVRVLRIAGSFNYALLNNRAVATTKGELLGFINNDIDVIEPNWLDEMVSQAMRPGVGAVGAKLFYADDTIQHGGVTLGVGGIAGHVHRGVPRSEPGYLNRLLVAQNIACVTAACMIMSRQLFVDIGGFDETELAVAFNDVDLCMKIRRAGYSIVWTPFAELYHLESASRGDDYSRAKAERFEREFATMRNRWADQLDADPYYNPNLTRLDEQSGLAYPPHLTTKWCAR